MDSEASSIPDPTRASGSRAVHGRLTEVSRHRWIEETRMEAQWPLLLVGMGGGYSTAATSKMKVNVER